MKDYQERTQAKARERRARALALYESGKTVEQVGKRFKVTKQRASQILEAARQDRANASD